MLIQKKVTKEMYNTFQSEKPISTSLAELDIDLQGITQINIKTEKEKLFESIVSDILPLLIFF
jgi:hypothetical protein